MSDQERIAQLEEQMAVAAEVIADLTATMTNSAQGGRHVWHLGAFNPLPITDPTRRREAWEHLYRFVELLNATFGARRTGTGSGPLYVRSGWWNNPLAVMHLAALCEAWVEASVTPGDPAAGRHDMLWQLLDQVVPTLELICGRSTEHKWGQQEQVEFSYDPPRPIRAVEENRRQAFEEFLRTDTPLEAHTALTSVVLAELNTAP